MPGEQQGIAEGGSWLEKAFMPLENLKNKLSRSRNVFSPFVCDSIGEEALREAHPLESLQWGIQEVVFDIRREPAGIDGGNGAEQDFDGVDVSPNNYVHAECAGAISCTLIVALCFVSLW